MKGWRTAWRHLTTKAGLKGLRFHDLRHQAITELCEAGLSDMTIMGIAGHVSKEMLAHYSHIRLQAKRQAVEALEMSLPMPAKASRRSRVSEGELSGIPATYRLPRRHMTNAPLSPNDSPHHPLPLLLAAGRLQPVLDADAGAHGGSVRPTSSSEMSRQASRRH